MTITLRRRLQPRWWVLVIASLVAASACGRDAATEAARRIEPVYDASTGKLQLLKYDSDDSGRVDTWSYMDGARVIRIEIDRNEDGKLDRWEYYGPDRRLERVGISRVNDGKVDAWTHHAPDGSVVRVEVSTKHDGAFDRIEFYENGMIARAEEDTDRDGKVDKWESYEGGRLASVAFDTVRRGVPDRRLLYGADGSARLEVAPRGDGRFVPLGRPAPSTTSPSRGGR